jgi:polyisoprenoid-binding protein YceI
VASIPRVQHLLADARANKMPVIYTGSPAANATNDPVTALKPASGEPMVRGAPDKFLGSDLDKILKAKGVRSVILVGIADGAVFYTASHAALNDLNVIIPVDGISSTNQFGELYTVWHLKNTLSQISGRVTLTKADLVTFKPAAAEETYVIDSVHSQPQYVAGHVGFSEQHGSFGKMTGKVVLDRAAKKGTVEMTIDTKSVRTHDSRFDAIIKGDRFLNVEKFPTITFKSTKLTFDGDKITGIEGDMTLLGVTKPVKFAVDKFVCGQNPFNRKALCGAEATTTLKRSEFGMTFGLAQNNPSDDLKIIVPIEAYLED